MKHSSQTCCGIHTIVAITQKAICEIFVIATSKKKKKNTKYKHR